MRKVRKKTKTTRCKTAPEAGGKPKIIRKIFGRKPVKNEEILKP